MSKKNFVLDTSVLLHDPGCLDSLQDNNIYIPFTVLEELDHFKKNEDDTGRNSRALARRLDKLREQGSLIQGVVLPNGGTIRVTNKYMPPSGLDIKLNDHKILATAYGLKFEGKENVIFLTNDINLRIKADAFDITAERFGKTKLPTKSLYPGVKEIKLPAKVYAEFKRNGWVVAPKEDFYPNQYLVITKADTGTTTLGRYTEDTIVKLIDIRDSLFGIYPKNNEQRFAIDALLNDDIKLVSLIGQAGTGKTLLAVAAGLQKIVHEKNFTKLLVSRPIQPMGKEMGFLPGDINEKMNPWMQPIYDNLEFLFDIEKRHKKPSKKRKTTKDKAPERSTDNKSYSHLIDSGLIQVEALTYIRGRSIPEQYMIVDESQNLSPHEIKTIITRAGEGTKIIITGDTQQIDSPYLDETSNGLSYAVERMKELELSAHVTLSQGERSPLAEAGSKLL